MGIIRPSAGFLLHEQQLLFVKRPDQSRLFGVVDWWLVVWNLKGLLFQKKVTCIPRTVPTTTCQNREFEIETTQLLEFVQDSSCNLKHEAHTDWERLDDPKDFP